MRTKDLIEVLETLRKAFPTLRQISSYDRAQTMVKKSGKPWHQAKVLLRRSFTSFGYRSSDNGIFQHLVKTDRAGRVDPF